MNFSCQIFSAVDHCFEWCSSAAHLTLMCAFIVVVIKPFVKISLQLLNGLVYLLAEGDLIKLLQDRFMKSLADTIGLGLFHFGFGMINVVNGKEKLIIVAFRFAALSGSPTS
ncbi:hypothetical protein FHS77_003267 [Paenochrobactrum gallinarii]|uniref:Uncharacterized protein n=1 Tax=Paenochrobactrum gallinarii TaxID=643673 RepID=A0A841M1Q3_9HYPH|nr:hypothetical protein [Paenochrobactrum gallinarii]